MGICLIIQTSIKVLGYSSKSYIDELTAVATCFFTLSCVFSYLAIRTQFEKRSQRLENIGDIIFLIGLLLLFIMVLLISINEIS